jgi:DNA-binding transcriptional LysR family regulator
LEAELGVPLFERVPQGVILTGAGEHFLPYARQVIATMRDGVEAVQEWAHAENGLLQGTVNIAVVGTLAGTDLTEIFLRFRRAHPQVKLMLRTARSNEVSAMVQHGEAHLGLRYFADPSTEIESHRIQEEPLVVVGSGQREGGAIESLTNLAWVSFPIGEGNSGEPLAKLLKGQLEKFDLGQADIITIDSLTAQKRLIEADFGVGLVPISAIQEELKLGTLQIIEVAGWELRIPIMLLHRRAGYLSKVARSLIDEFLG